ncbi:uncharacterized protein L201_004769 [Kwoniella dendrophila CBS 6074]|uniref:Zn(2)-C6 fungal-type domain-containing protein n=1 Tax=Kwoniella dendrophila CBS 6074 TaxID=1295534 RepID=A0AAX4JX65_9TREE
MSYQYHQQQHHQYTSSSSSSFYLDPSAIPIASFGSPSHYPETYLQRLVKAKQAGPSVPSSFTCNQYYNSADHHYYSSSSSSNGGHTGMSAVAVLPPSEPFSMMESHQNMQKAMMGYPSQARQPSFTAGPTVDQPLKQPNTLTHASQNDNNGMTRFQQLMAKKFAAEQSSRGASLSTQSSQEVNTSNDYLKTVQEQMMRQNSNTVFHKDFVSNQYNSPGQQHQYLANQAKDVKPVFHQQPINYTNTPTSNSAYGSHERIVSLPQTQTQLQPAAPQYQRRSVSQPQQHPYTASIPGNPSMVYQSPTAMTSAMPRGQYAGEPHPAEWDSTYGQPETAQSLYSQTHPAISVGYTVNNPSPASSTATLIKEENVNEHQLMQNAGMNGWVTTLAPTRKSSGVSDPHEVISSRNHQKNQAAPAFSWYVSDTRSNNGESSYQSQNTFDRTPALSPNVPYSSLNPSSTSLPVTPTGLNHYIQPQSSTSSSYITVKTEPDTQHLNVPCSYPYQSGPSTHTSPSTAFSSSPLLEYGARMFTNMNGTFQLPTSGMYMASTNGGGESSNMNNGLGDGGEGSSGGNGGENWSNGNGNANGESSGSDGQAGSGHENYNGNDGSDPNGNGDGNDEGNGSMRKGKKLTLACHFCRRRKLKCNGVQPKCDNCTKRNEVCTWDDNVRRRGPGKATKERREKAAREAMAAGLTNSDSLHALPDQIPSDLQHDHDHVHLHDHEHQHDHSNGEIIGLGGNGNELPIVDALSSVLQSEGAVREEEFRLNLGINVADQQDQIAQRINQIEAIQQQQQQIHQGSSNIADGNNNIEPVGIGRLPEIDPNIQIDPALAALSAAIPGTLAELEQPNSGNGNANQGQKRKSDIISAESITGNGFNGEIEGKRMKLDPDNLQKS